MRATAPRAPVTGNVRRQQMTGIATLTAICIRCGASKKRAPAKCHACGFLPLSNADLAKSFILSKTFDVGERSIGRSAPDLAQISRTIATGAPYQFSEAEVATVAAEVSSYKSITPRRLAIDLIKWLGPPILLAGIVYALLGAA